jgi:iron-sulfur cluster repair protein YtfE (RIC family)
MNNLLPAPPVTECEPEWQTRSVSVLATHISGVYHERMRDELPVLTRQVAALISRFSDLRVFQLRALGGLLAELRNEVDAHAWTEDDLLFPVLAACENPAVLTTTLTPDRMLRLVDSLAEDHVRIRQILARLTAYITEVTPEASKVADWADLLHRVRRLRDLMLEEMDLEDRCLLPRARSFAETEAGRIYR